MMTRRMLIALAAGGAVAGAARAQDGAVRLTVEAGVHARANAVARVLIPVSERDAGLTTMTVTGPGGLSLVGQLTAPGLAAKVPDARGGSVWRELHFIVPSLEAGRKLDLRAVPARGAAPAGFRWEADGPHVDVLRHGDQPVLRYMRQRIDESSTEARHLTYKPFHHLYDPAGTRLLTKGPGGQFTHHRGLFFGFNRVSYGDKKADVWHCTGDAHQLHQKVLRSEAGPVLGRHLVEITWHGPGKEPFAREQREMTVYRIAGAQVVEFAARVESNVGPVRLDGDPQHAGFHFRADDEVAAVTKAQTYYLRPDGRGAPGETRNWPNQKTHINLPWNAMSFVLGGRRYTALYLDHPNNPKEARYSERDYGRFGSYFEYDLDRDRPLRVNYRVWAQDGELSPEEAAARAADFHQPLAVRLR